MDVPLSTLKTMVKQLQSEISTITAEKTEQTTELNKLFGEFHQIQYSINKWDLQIKADLKEYNKLNTNLSSIKLKTRQKEKLLKNLDIGKPSEEFSSETLSIEHRAILKEQKLILEEIDQIKVKQHIVKLDIQDMKEQHEQFMIHCKEENEKLENNLAVIKIKQLEKIAALRTNFQ